MEFDPCYIPKEHRSLWSWEIAKHFFHFGWHLAKEERKTGKPVISLNFDTLVLDELERAAYDLSHSLLWTETRERALQFAHDGYRHYRFN